MSISIKDILEIVSETREALIIDYQNSKDKDSDYEPSQKELMKHIVDLFREGTHLELLEEIGVLENLDENIYAALLLVSAVEIDSGR